MVVVDRVDDSTLLKVPTYSPWGVVPTEANGKPAVGYVTEEVNTFEVVDAEGELAFSFQAEPGEKLLKSARSPQDGSYFLLTPSSIYRLDAQGELKATHQFERENNLRKMTLLPKGGLLVSGYGRLTRFDQQLKETSDQPFSAQEFYSPDAANVFFKQKGQLLLFKDEGPQKISQGRLLGRQPTATPDGRIWFLETDDEGPPRAVAYDPVRSQRQTFPTTEKAAALVPCKDGRFLVVEDSDRPRLLVYGAEGDLEKAVKFDQGKIDGFQLSPDQKQLLVGTYDGYGDQQTSRLHRVDLTPAGGLQGLWGRLQSSVGLDEVAEQLLESKGPLEAVLLADGGVAALHQQGIEFLGGARSGERYQNGRELVDQMKQLPQASGQNFYLGVDFSAGSDRKESFPLFLSQGSRRHGWVDPTAVRLDEGEGFRVSYTDQTVLVRNQSADTRGFRSAAESSFEATTRESLFESELRFPGPRQGGVELDGNKVVVKLYALGQQEALEGHFYCGNRAEMTQAVPVQVGDSYFVAAASSDGQMHWYDLGRDRHLKFNLDQPVEHLWAGPDDKIRGKTEDGAVFALKLELPPGGRVQSGSEAPDLDFLEDEIVVGSFSLNIQD